MTIAPCIAAGELVGSEQEWLLAGQNLRDVARELRFMLRAGTPVALATVVSASGPAVRAPGTVLVTSASGQALGFHPAGPLDQAIRDLARTAVTTGLSSLTSLDIDADAASYIGLSGAVSLDVQVVSVRARDRVFARVLRYLDSGKATVLILGVGASAGYAVVGARRIVGRLSWPAMPAAVIADARSMLGTPGTACKRYGQQGEPDGANVRLWMQSYPPA